MSHRYYILIVIVLGSTVLFGQKKSKFNKLKNQQSPQEMLDRAKSLKDDQPQVSIDIISELVTSTKSAEYRSMVIESYILLGSIYDDIRQNALAIDRYRMAIALIEKTDAKVLKESKFAQLAELYNRIGHLYLKLLQYDEASSAFEFCINSTGDPALSLRCHEGQLDVLLRKDSLDDFYDKIAFVRSNFPQDSITTARMEARMSEYYLKRSEFAFMQNSFQNSVLNIPSSTDVDFRDLEPIDLAQVNILNSDKVSIEQKQVTQSGVIALNERRRYRSSGNDLGIRSNYKKAELYEYDKDPNNAKVYLDVSKSLITNSTKASTKAEVYKKSAEYNQRFGQVTLALDDLEKYIEAKEKAIKELEDQLASEIEIIKKQQLIDLSLKDALIVEKEDKLYENRLNNRNILISLLSLLLLGSLIYFYFLYRSIKEKKIANKRLELRSLNAQMNPHFVFNALNSVNNFISKNDEISANKFLTDFSMLMRKVLHHSQTEFVNLEEELELIQLYVHLEQFRFRDKFDVVIENKIEVVDQQLLVPPMLIQPYIENAVWHGLRYKEDRGELKIIIEDIGDSISIQVIDNGIGRSQSAQRKTLNQKKYKSTGMSNAKKRIALLSEIYNKDYSVVVSDKEMEGVIEGTIVGIKIPKLYV